MRNWFFTDYTIPSDKNGTIIVRRRFGTWWVWVDECSQTGEYTYDMWVHAFKMLKLPRTYTRILMLGLGAGGQIKTLYKQFPDAELTVVEYDPAMIALTKEFKLYAPYSLPHIIEGDAAKVVPTLTDTYDLILLDLFAGPEPSPLAKDAAFVDALSARLATNGVMIANVYRRGEYLDSLASRMHELKRWTFRINWLGLFERQKM